ncbi:MAG: 16S rRNA (cytidine(1402)-2'-O)-methyltransferase [Actinomycetota bacterium]|nr:16S rRNA (cytidine(1402)-2'-O)-methyltransferase [Actinomycetota bacterium]MDQ2958294.1 16S rRNA (cytidine(1402)-2'-O)-methyltransferase [Actinomycetota bacterium]
MTPAADRTQPDVGRLILAGAPLGRPSDASTGLAQALASCPVIAAEDTRRLHRLAADLGVRLTGRVLSFFEGNEQGRVPQLVEQLQAGRDVLVITDAGMPSVSDPGYRLVLAAIEAGLPVTSLPGPSAVTTALAVSGLPVDRFCFEGFLPRKGAGRRKLLAELGSERRTMVFFESPHRLADALADLVTAFGGDRPAAVCRELTKTYEEVKRASLTELAGWAADQDVRGEITLVVAGAADQGEDRSAAELAELVGIREAAGEPRKDAIAAVALQAGLAKRLVFDAVVAAKKPATAADQPAGDPH